MERIQPCIHIEDNKITHVTDSDGITYDELDVVYVSGNLFRDKNILLSDNILLYNHMYREYITYVLPRQYSFSDDSRSWEQKNVADKPDTGDYVNLETLFDEIKLEQIDNNKRYAIHELLIDNFVKKMKHLRILKLVYFDQSDLLQNNVGKYLTEVAGKYLVDSETITTRTTTHYIIGGKLYRLYEIMLMVKSQNPSTKVGRIGYINYSLQIMSSCFVKYNTNNAGNYYIPTTISVHNFTNDNTDYANKCLPSKSENNIIIIDSTDENQIEFAKCLYRSTKTLTNNRGILCLCDKDEYDSEGNILYREKT